MKANKEETKEMVQVETQDVPFSDNTQLENFVNPDMAMYCSLKADKTRASKVKLFNLMSNPAQKLADHVNEQLEITEVIAQPIRLISEETGEYNECMRIILIDKNDVGYACVSMGVTSALEKIFHLFGKPSWADEPIKMTPKNVKISGNKTVLTIALAE